MQKTTGAVSFQPAPKSEGDKKRDILARLSPLPLRGRNNQARSSDHSQLYSQSKACMPAEYETPCLFFFFKRENFVFQNVVELTREYYKVHHTSASDLNHARKGEILLSEGYVIPVHGFFLGSHVWSLLCP